MIVRQLSTRENSGGAAKAAFRLNSALQMESVDSKMLVKFRQTSLRNVETFKWPEPKSYHQKFKRLLNKKLQPRELYPYYSTISSKYERFSSGRGELFFSSPDSISSNNIDLVNLHWVANFIDLESFFNFTDVPVVWTLHDMNAFTGGCHYDLGCGAYNRQCGECPFLGGNKTDDLSRSVWLQKQRIFSQLNGRQLHFVSPSRWLAHEVKESQLVSHLPVSVIPNSVDVNIFKPCETTQLREKLAIPQDNKVLLFVSEGLSNFRKGMDYLVKALDKLEDTEKLTCVLLGKADDQLDIPGVQIIQVGMTTDEYLLSMLYSMSDLYVITSLQDNLPNTIMESMASGTPVVGFECGGVPDMVKHGETGWLVKQGDVRALKDTLAAALSNRHRLTEMALNSRNLAVNLYSPEIQAKAYHSLYRKMIDEYQAV